MMEIGRKRIMFTMENIHYNCENDSNINIFYIKNENSYKEYEKVVNELLEYFKNLSDTNKGEQIIVQIVFCLQDSTLYEGLVGFVNSIYLENPNLVPQLIFLESDISSEEINKILQKEFDISEKSIVAYKNGIRYVYTIEAFDEESSDEYANESLWKDNGIYLITGGAGGVGLLFAEHISSVVKNSVIILTGRSNKNVAEICEQKNIALNNVIVDYFQCDVSNMKSVSELAQKIYDKYGKITGVIHAAGINKDAFFVKKTEQEVKSVLMPKMQGLINLESAFENIQIDFWLLVSSSAGVKGNIGQTDYAAANGFLDAYAKLRNNTTSNGRMISVNWPLWKDGGMQVDEKTINRIKAATGMEPLQTEKAFNILDFAVKKDIRHFIPMEGDQQKIENWLLERTSEEKESEKEQTYNADEKKTKLAFEKYLKQVLSEQINLPISRIDARVPIEEFGLTSIMTMDLTDALEKEFGQLPKTLFFEYQTLRELSEYFYKSHFKKVCEKTGFIKEKVNKTPKVKQEVLFKPKTTIKTVEKIVEPNMSNGWDIAVIGLAGQYPKAENVEILWENIKEGKDCISTISNNRWNHNEYYDEDKTKPGKTYAKWGGFLENAECFDPLFFHISPIEAETIDPQERIFLQCVYHAMEDAGYTKDNLNMTEKYGLRNNVGVFVGVMYEDYQLYGAQAQTRGEMYSLNGSEASIANRVSYTYGFHGPSMSVDSMCSSSLSALQLACKSILDGDCNVAIAGGVNLSLHPNKFLMLGQSRFLSTKGKCESFGEGGDGYVPGEGVGAVVLKPLHQAEIDGDHIYGVIKSVAVNHCGKTNGYTVPNPKAQTAVILDAWKKAGISPRAISYIEAHGTGTALGDPIEIAGITHAFDTVTADKQFVQIGSVKSNIGHCESAAGIAGLIKILMQMKYKQIAPSIHSSILNKKITFEQTPCTVPHKLMHWKQPEILEDNQLKQYPRIAGLSAFGAGGTNAHVIVEENTNRDNGKQTEKEIPLFLLSARTKEQLEQKATDLLNWLENNDNNLKSGIYRLTDISYTLLVGREAMEERAAFVAESLDELKAMLSNISNGSYENVYAGKNDKWNDFFDVMNEDEDLSELVVQWIKKGKYDKIADMWVKGMVFQWQNFFSTENYRRISLPLYPFKKDRYWRPDRDKTGLNENVSSVIIDRIHPLIEKNVSDFTEQKYKTVFRTEDRILKDHKVNGICTLPAVAYFEMVQKSFLDAINKVNKRVEFSDVLWIKPCTIFDKEEKEVYVSFHPRDNEKAEFFVYSISNDNEMQQKEMYCTGTIALLSNEHTEKLSLQDLWANGEKIAEKTKIYECFERIGLKYGESHHSVHSIKKVDNFVLAKLHLPDFLVEDMKKYYLYPSIMDGALQAAIALGEEITVFDLEAEKLIETNAKIPFMIKKLIVSDGCSPDMWAIISEDKETEDRVNITLCDDNGNVCVVFKQVWYKKIGIEPEKKSYIMFEPVEQVLTEKNKKEENYSYRVIHTIGVEENLCNAIKNCGYWDECNVFYDKKNVLSIDEYKHYFTEAFKYIKKRMTDCKNQKTLIQVVVSNQCSVLLESISGIFKSIYQENPMFTGQCLVLEENKLNTVDDLKETEKYSHFPILYLGGNLKTIIYKDVNISNSHTTTWKDGGIYCITGGFGGIGKIFAKEIAQKTPNAKIALISRSVLDEKKKDFIKELKNLGAECQYYQADVSRKDSVNNMIKSIVEDFGGLNGIIHCAGITKDNFIIRKSLEEWNEVLSPKLDGTWYLDEACKDLKLDFFALFSSLTAVTGNIGQADYALANSFLDQFAVYRNQLVKRGERYGKTISFNWPFWKNGGIELDSNYIEAMKKRSGLLPIDDEVGIEAFYNAYSMNLERVVPLTGEIEQIKAMFKFKEEFEKEKEENNTEEIRPVNSIVDRETALKEYLIQVFSEKLLLKKDNIQEDTLFEYYGIDSIFATSITEYMEKDFGALPKTILFECQNIKSLAECLLQEYSKKVDELIYKKNNTLIDKNIYKTEKNITEEKNKNEAQTTYSRFIKTEESGNVEVVEEQDEIAIIGMAGSYAQSEDLNALWENLKAGKDCITEIPKERWDYNLYYNPDKDNSGTSYSKWGGFLRKIDEFDPLFFNISPSYAEIMDPQEKIFLETAYHAVEDAGYTKESFGYQPGGKVRRNVGVFVGVMNEEYQLYAAEEQLKGNPVVVSGNTSSVANRVSYFFDFHGPSLSIDTMCSSSLVAVHLACQSIQNKDCEMAIAGGVNVMIHPNKFLTISQSKFASTNGKCMSFGKGGDGYVPGEGVGALILKSKKKAIQDGDHIYGIIKGTSVNHGGKTSGYTVPNPNAQTEVIRTALDKAGVNARNVSYIEAHGTGTALGDPIEIRALSKAFKEDTEDCGYCAIGSVKSNVGHCESASGVVAISKVLLQMKYKQLVPSIHSEELNPNIVFEKTPFRVQRKLEEWDKIIIDDGNGTRECPRIAGVSSFGAGGTNAHVIIQEYEEVSEIDNDNRESVIVLSSQTEWGLKQMVANLKKHLEVYHNISLADISYTLVNGREHFDVALAFVVSSIEELKEKLQNYLVDNLVGIEIVKEKIDALVNQYNPIGKRISLPGYVFDNQRYWIQRTENGVFSHINKEKSITVTGKESYVRDHIVGEKHVIPGAALLELLRKYASQEKKQSISVIENIMWMRQIEVDEKSSVDLQVKLDDDKDNSFEVYNGKDVVFTGKIGYGISEIPRVSRKELKEIEKVCVTEIKRNECYDYFSSVGLPSGSTFIVIDSIYAGENSGYAILSEAQNMTDDAIISPALLNGVFQSVIGLMIDQENSSGLMLPFALEKLYLYKAFTKHCRVYIQKVQKTKKMQKFSILVTDDNYEPICLLDNFVLRAVSTGTEEQNIVISKDNYIQKKNYYTEEWEEKNLNEFSNNTLQGKNICILGKVPKFSEEVQMFMNSQNVVEVAYGEAMKEIDSNHYSIRCDMNEDFENLLLALEKQEKFPQKIILFADGADHTERMKKGLYSLVNLSKALMSCKPRERIEILFVYGFSEDEVVPEYAGVTGFVKAVQMENPTIVYKIVGVQKVSGLDAFSKESVNIINEFSCMEDVEVLLKEDTRMKKSVRRIEDL
ncbi:MAG: SDR family NAD(P)-dependent oxidoreductase [Acutalibacteraceae bacterium]|nr:SDR family NAD(P)-dependent oxidoreductase [Acutalibacteraceae bacterium]